MAIFKILILFEIYEYTSEVFLQQKTRLIYSNGLIVYMILHNIITTSLERGKNDDDDVIDLKT